MTCPPSANASLTDCTNGLLIAPGDSVALSHAMIELLGDAGLRAAMGRRGRELVSERFALPVMVDGNLAIYRRVLGHGGGRDRRSFFRNYQHRRIA